MIPIKCLVNQEGVYPCLSGVYPSHKHFKNRDPVNLKRVLWSVRDGVKVFWWKGGCEKILDCCGIGEWFSAMV